jgi:predicted CoA-substrate-specific enzyme activase
MISAGIDAGSRTIKVVLIRQSDLSIAGTGVADQGVRQSERALTLLDEVAAKAGLSRRDIGRIVATGYGRDSIDVAHTTITEITCHACGVRHVMPDARTVVDIGGQDSKLLRLDPEGRVHDFVMNDRCAAGTGRFLEVVASRLEIQLNDLGPLARRSSAPCAISSMCVVFAETEIIGLLASGAEPADIAAGIQTSIATRAAAMAGGKIVSPVAFTGGVALMPGMREALEAALGRPVRTVSDPQLTGALGAAILAATQRSIP